MKIIAIEPIGMSPDELSSYEKELAAQGHQFISFPDRKEDPETVKQRMQHADIVIESNIPLDRDILSACPQLKFIAVAFTGTDHIDMEYCRIQGIEVKNAPGYATTAVSELVVALIFGLYRSIILMDNATRHGGSRGDRLGYEIKDKTAGIIGTGAIGKQTALYLKNLGCRIVAWNRTPDPELIKEGVQYVSFDRLMEISDIISLHLPLTPETENIVSSDKIELCKPNAILINTARGKLVDMPALYRALQNRKLAGAGIDVFEKEPPLPPDHPLLQAPNCIVMPHIGYATHEAFDRRIIIVMNNIRSWLKAHKA